MEDPDTAENAGRASAQDERPAVQLPGQPQVMEPDQQNSGALDVCSQVKPNVQRLIDRLASDRAAQTATGFVASIGTAPGTQHTLDVTKTGPQTEEFKWRSEAKPDENERITLGDALHHDLIDEDSASAKGRQQVHADTLNSKARDTSLLDLIRHQAKGLGAIEDVQRKTAHREALSSGRRSPDKLEARTADEDEYEIV